MVDSHPSPEQNSTLSHDNEYTSITQVKRKSKRDSEVFSRSQFPHRLLQNFLDVTMRKAFYVLDESKPGNSIPSLMPKRYNQTCPSCRLVFLVASKKKFYMKLSAHVKNLYNILSHLEAYSQKYGCSI